MKNNEAVNFNLHDRAIFISGGAGDIGEVIVETFVAQKSKVVIADLDGEKAEALAQKYGSNCVLFLASPYAKNISGEVVSVDGALTVRMSLPKP